MADQYEETFFWLSDSMIANECRRVSDPNVGLSLTESDTYIKCYLGDTGLLVSHAFDENELLEDEVYKQIFAGKLGLNEGMLYENVIAQMLASNGHRLFFYTQYNAEKRRNDIEIDFIIANNSKTKYKMYPIEVKSSAKYSFESLKRFKEKYKSRIGGCYIIHPRNLIEKDNILCIPPYMTIKRSQSKRRRFCNYDAVSVLHGGAGRYQSPDRRPNHRTLPRAEDPLSPFRRGSAVPPV